MSDVQNDDHGDAGGHDEHHDDVSMYTIAGFMLVLTAATFLTLYMPKGIWSPMTNTLFVLAIAFCKATLVVAFFMHYKYEKSWKYVVSIPACIVGIATIFALMPDIAIGTWPKGTWHP
jgi:caa(3)-type oxidase subunit IV